jgi:hypothetical protein
LAKWTGSIALRWTETGSGVTSFEIERSTDGVTFDVIGTTGSGQTSYVDNTATAGVQYTYEIVAVEGAATATSDTVTVTPLASGNPDGQGKFCNQPWQTYTDPSGSPSSDKDYGSVNKPFTVRKSGSSVPHGNCSGDSSNNETQKIKGWLYGKWTDRHHRH